MTPPHIAEAFLQQAVACDSLGSPFMGQLMRLFASEHWPDCAVTARIFGWPGQVGPRDQSVPLRLAGGLHALHLGGHPVLTPVYPPNRADDAALWQAICTVLTTETAYIDHWLDFAPQTNEVRRSAALIATGHLLAAIYGLPLRTSELGASGGLNLHWDSYALQIGEVLFGPKDAVLTLTPDWVGHLPPEAQPEVLSRSGVDLHPLEPGLARDALRLQAYLWPDQAERLRLTRAAIDAARTRVSQGDAIDWLGERLTHEAGVVHLIYSTIAWQYFPHAAQARGEAMIAEAGRRATDQSPLAWFGMENDGGERGAALTLRLWPGNSRYDLGRADFHGRWIDWRADPAMMAK